MYTVWSSNHFCPAMPQVVMSGSSATVGELRFGPGVRRRMAEIESVGCLFGEMAEVELRRERG